MLSVEFKRKIRHNWLYNRQFTTWGNYRYKYDEYLGAYYRCRNDNYNREWLTRDGRVTSGWEESSDLARLRHGLDVHRSCGRIRDSTDR